MLTYEKYYILQLCLWDTPFIYLLLAHINFKFWITTWVDLVFHQANMLLKVNKVADLQALTSEAYSIKLSRKEAARFRNIVLTTLH